MRTTLTIDDDVLNAVRSLATERGQSLGQVVSELVRRGLRPESAPTYANDFPVFAVRDSAAPITSEMVRTALEES